MINPSVPSPDPGRDILSHYGQAGVKVLAWEARHYPQETIYIVRVSPADLARAIAVAAEIDTALQSRGLNAFVTVRPGDSPTSRVDGAARPRGAASSEAAHLATLLIERAKTSDLQGSLEYVPQAAVNVEAVAGPRHHLVFGRRGAGKTALLARAREAMLERGQFCFWVNLKSYRHETADDLFLDIASQFATQLRQHAAVATGRDALLAQRTDTIRQQLERLNVESDRRHAAQTTVAKLHTLLKLLRDFGAGRAFLFLDDLHYFRKDEQPRLLDYLHSAVNECDVWLKVATIRYLSRWFEREPEPLGLQTDHDADVVDLDVTLQEPVQSKDFLERVLLSYARHVGFDRLAAVFAASALDRLLLASGAVPRDYVTLAARTIREAAKRQVAKRQKVSLAGVQDVNRAAGEMAQVKTAELEEDIGAVTAERGDILRALDTVRRFCLDDKRYSFFRVDAREREHGAIEYSLLQRLLDLRLIHLVNPSLSDQHEAGHRFEVFMLDLSQFTSQRFRKQLLVLDLQDGRFMLKKTGTPKPVRVGDTPLKVVDILRRGPVLMLSSLRVAGRS